MGFYAKLVVKHLNYEIGQSVYVKPVEWKFSAPTRYAILDVRSGMEVDYVTANTFRNRFERD